MSLKYRETIKFYDYTVDKTPITSSLYIVKYIYSIIINSDAWLILLRVLECHREYNKNVSKYDI